MFSHRVSRMFLPSSCYGWGKPDLIIKGCVIHYMSAVNIDPNKMFDVETNLQILRDYRFSYHFLIDRAGHIYQLVPLNKQAYHAGKSKFKNLKSCNKHSIGICLLGGKESMVSKENKHFTLHQYGSCASIINTMINLSGEDFINDYIVGHSEVATPKGRKQDPGEEFDWDLLGSAMGATWGNDLLEETWSHG